MKRRALIDTLAIAAAVLLAAALIALGIVAAFYS